MKTSESIVNISKALVTASKSIGKAVKGQKNPFFKSKYADLASIIEAVKEPLEDNGIIVLQPMTKIEDRTFLQTTLLHQSGEFLTSEIPLSLNGKEQELGSRITYLRRYQLQSMLSIPAVDDDGNAASNARITQNTVFNNSIPQISAWAEKVFAELKVIDRSIKVAITAEATRERVKMGDFRKFVQIKLEHGND